MTRLFNPTIAQLQQAAKDAIEGKIENFRKSLVDKLLEQYDLFRKIYGSVLQRLAKKVAVVAAEGAAAAGQQFFNSLPPLLKLILNIGGKDANNIKEVEIKNIAEGFVALIEDILDDREKIEERFGKIAGLFAKRFYHQIRYLENNNDGVVKFAEFIALAIAQNLPSKKGEIDKYRDAGKIEELLDYVVREALPLKLKDKNDQLYRTRFSGNITVAAGNRGWSLRGMVFSAPRVFHNFAITKEFYVCDDVKSGAVAKAKKYPPQVVNTSEPSFNKLDQKRATDVAQGISYINQFISEDPFTEKSTASVSLEEKQFADCKAKLTNQYQFQFAAASNVDAKTTAQLASEFDACCAELSRFLNS